MARVLVLADAGCNTGFGVVTHSIGERLVRDYGHELHVLAINYRGDSYPSILDPSQPTLLRLYMPTQLRGDDMYGQTRFVEMLGMLGETKGGLDVVWVLNDPHVLLRFLFQNPYDAQHVLMRYRPIIAYLPCDGTNLPPQWTRELPKATNVVAMSKWGQERYDPSQLVYHGVDTDVFHPVKETPIKLSNGTTVRSKRDAKRAFGFDPEGFLIGRIDKNSGRKDYAALIKAVMPVMARNKDIQLYMHCAPDQPQDGLNIAVMLSRFPEIDAKARVFLPGQLNTFVDLPQNDLAVLFNAFDVYVSTSRGEGFGLGLAQAEACGVPVIAQNVSAIPEVVGPGGVLVEPKGLLTVPSGEDVWLPDVDAFSAAIETLYASRSRRRDLGEAGITHVRESFNWDAATAQFDKFITGLATATP